MATLIAEDGGKRQHRQCLEHLLETTTGPIRIASAYITDTELLLGVTNRQVQILTSLLRMDVISNATSLKALKTLIEMGVQSRCFTDGPRLHAKVYIFDDECAVVTSANLTRNALNSNIEVGIQFTGTAVKDVSRWFDTLWGKAEDLDLPKVAQWEQQTAGLRRDYAALRRKANAKPPLPHEASPSVSSKAKLRHLFENAGGFFLCNTDRRQGTRTASHGYMLEEAMRSTGYAAAWEQFKYPAHMDRVKQGDAILMFAKRVGIIGIGRARTGREIRDGNDADRVSRIGNVDYQKNDREWRVPVDWVVWAENDTDACPFRSPNATFLDLKAEQYSEKLEEVRRHFLPTS